MQKEEQTESLGARAGPRGLLEVRGLTARYGPVTAVRDVSLEVRAGEIVALLGANGAGKSTTLACVAGLHRSRHGQIRFDGEDVSRLSPERVLRRGISLTPEGRRLFSTLTVRENLLLGGAARGRRNRNDYGELLSLFPILRERLHQPAALLSGGEQQQLAIARSLMSRPRLLLLDEPTLGLAPMLVRQVLDLIRHFRDEQGLSVLMVDQNVHQALDLCDRGYILRTGEIAATGSPEELRRSREVQAAYLGVA
ncbi:MAG: ABC transporter ATP-binding protein [Actinobacteria bacterium]|nr:MAG: ABC transporter ATP-binding protein [Actinomycetota bacterium]